MTEPAPINLEELAAWRKREGLSYVEVGRLLGYTSGNNYSRMERGLTPVSRKAAEKLRRLIAAGAGDGASSGSGESSSGGDDAGSSGTDRGDLPPIAIAPGEPDDDTPPARGGARRLDSFETLERELSKLIVGADYLYPDFDNGRPVTKTGHIIGLTDLLDGIGWHGDAMLIRQLTPELVHGYVEWAKSSRRVLSILRMLTAGGAAKDALIPTAQLVVGLLMLHGLMPSPAALLGYGASVTPPPSDDAAPES